MVSEDFVIGKGGILDLRIPQVELSWDIFNFTHSRFLLQPPNSHPFVPFLTSSPT